MADNVASNNVEITEVSSAEVNTASNGVQQPIPIVEEPNNNKVPQLNVIPEGNPSSENTVITEIINNPKQDVLAAALKSAKAKPVPQGHTRRCGPLALGARSLLFLRLQRKHHWCISRHFR